MPVATLPEQAQLVQVRQRRSVATEVRQRVFPPHPLTIHYPILQQSVTLHRSYIWSNDAIS